MSSWKLDQVTRGLEKTDLNNVVTILSNRGRYNTAQVQGLIFLFVSDLLQSSSQMTKNNNLKKKKKGQK